MSPERHVLISAGVALVMIAVPSVAMAVVVVPDWSEKILPYFMVTLMPGFFVAALTGGNVHDYSRLVVCAGSFLLWFVLAFGLIWLVSWQRGIGRAA